jgi:predicted nucleic acid-binding Zn finger protein
MSGSGMDRTMAFGSVKKLLFNPSGRVLWAVVGRDNEHWSDLELGFCTCKDFYFKALSGGPECYHLRSIRSAIGDSGFIKMEFDDSEYVQVMQAIVDDQSAMLSRC